MTKSKNDQELQSDQKNQAEVESAGQSRIIDESAVAEKQRRELLLFAEMQEKADIIDKEMTRNGPPELDLNSG